MNIVKFFLIEATCVHSLKRSFRLVQFGKLKKLVDSVCQPMLNFFYTLVSLSFRIPSYVFTNGSAYFKSSNTLIKSDYQCLDRYLNNGKLSQLPAVMSCQNIQETQPVPKEAEPSCEKGVEFCIPKCCPKDEIFHLKLQR